MENNFDSVIDMFLYEADTLLEQLDEILLEAEDAHEFSDDAINEIFRIMHTIKGSAAMMQFNSIMETAHKIEDLFYYIRENGSIDEKFNEGLISLVFKCTDFIKNEITKIQEGEELTENIDEYEKEITEMLDIISGKKEFNEASEEKSVASDETTVENTQIVTNSNYKYCVNIFLDDDCGMENLRAFMIVNRLNDIGANFSFEPEDVETNSETIPLLIKDGLKLYFNDEEDFNMGVDVVKDSLNVKNYTVLEQEEHVEENTTEVDVASANANETKEKAAPKKVLKKHNKQSLISVNLDKLDELNNLVGELVINESMVISNPAVKGLNSDSFTKAARQLEKITGDLQNIVMSLRMVPVSGVFQKMKRIVRDMNKGLGKEANLVLIGDDIEVDKNVVDGIQDPIMHLVRNAMDHGIESTEERIANGKSPQGTVVLSAVNTGGEILISVKDDGKGLDPEYILNKAKNKGLLTKPENEYSKKEILGLIMKAGFSTKEQVTEFSGRGVGMDVVRKNIETIHGQILIDSEKGKGSTITFKIPLTLAIVDGMQIVVGDTMFIVPVKNIQQSINIDMKDVVKNTDGSESIMIRNRCYSIIRLHEQYDIDTDVTNLEEGILILIDSEEKSYGIFADKLLGEQKIVVKPLPALFNNFDIKESGVTGCSILGDGSINLILDVDGVHDNHMEE